MNPLRPQAPFVWPEPRVLEEMCTYEHQPPYAELALTAQSLFGIVSALTDRGIDAIEGWLEGNLDLKVCLTVAVYPTCATRRAALSRLVRAIGGASGRLSVRVHPLEQVSDRATNALCFTARESDVAHVVIGPSEDLGLGSREGEQANLTFRADPVLVQALRDYFDWHWARSGDISGRRVALIPELALPEGSEEAAQQWKAYASDCASAAAPDGAQRAVALVDPGTGEVTTVGEDGQKVPSPTEELGLPKLDPLAERVARLYEKGALVSIDKLSRIPPLDAPLDPNLFGDPAELQRGKVTRKVSMRVSIIDEKTLKEIEKRRQGLRPLLARFTFALADNVRWMPIAARGLFESELARLNSEGLKLISDLLEGGADAFVDASREALVADLNAMYERLGQPGKVTDDVIDGVVQSLKRRLGRAQSGSFMPKLSYSMVSFVSTDSVSASPWGQAYSLLADIAAFPRKALTDAFFFRGLRVSEDDLIEAMNVAGDALCRDLRARGIKGRCKAELEVLTNIERAAIESRARCELTCRILDGDPAEAILEALKHKDAS